MDDEIRKKIAEALEVSESNIKFKDDRYIIQDIEIKDNIKKLLDKNIKDINISFWRCEFCKIINLTGLTIDINFKFVDCKFKKDFIAKGENTKFNKDIIFDLCIFESLVNFSGAKFNSNVNFSISRFKGETRFIDTKFLVKEGENNFIEANFEGNVDFSRSEFNSNVNFEISRFKSEARFIGIKISCKRR